MRKIKEVLRLRQSPGRQKTAWSIGYRRSCLSAATSTTAFTCTSCGMATEPLRVWSVCTCTTISQSGNALGVILLFASAAFATDVRGKITSISVSVTNPALGTVLIEGKVEEDTSVDKASARVTAETSIFRMEDGKKVAGKFSDLKVGQTVEASFTGPVGESYPVQGAASEIVILQTR